MKTKLTILIIAIMLLSVFSVFAHEEDNCNVDIKKYAAQSKDFVNNNPDNKNVKYGKKFVGNNAVIELHVDDEVWHTKMMNGLMSDAVKGPVKGKTYTVYTSMCTLHDMEDSKLTAKDALKQGKITYKAHGMMNRMKARIARMFL